METTPPQPQTAVDEIYPTIATLDQIREGWNLLWMAASSGISLNNKSWGIVESGVEALARLFQNKAALAEVHKSRNLELKEMQHQRDMLASALGELLVSIGIVSSDVPLTGPDLLLAADTAAAHFKSKDTGKPQ
jgi:hypothetical protein